MPIVIALDEMSCGELASVAAELALGALTGRERARALAHLAQCDACQEKVRRLTVTGEDVLGLLPGRDPPPGFETRALARAGLPEATPGAAPGVAPGTRGWRRPLAVAARALAAARHRRHHRPGPGPGCPPS